jgi:uroporphyrinogen decarboxylase
LSSDRKLMRVLSGASERVPPVWLMRQAGRYLPEYRAVREKAGSFWSMALNPELAAEVTIQPIRRFGFDAAILFSDILTVPEALGQKVTFTAGEGPSLAPITSIGGLNEDRDSWARYFEPVYEALRRARAGLDKEGFQATALLGFAGAPWTLATYLAAGAGGDEQKAAKLWAHRDPEGFGYLLDILSDCVAFHLVRQLQAGADAVQIFDSWAAGLSDREFSDWIIKPTARITAMVRQQVPQARIIGFPRGMEPGMADRFQRATQMNAISVGTHTSLTAIWSSFAIPPMALQGNLDPEVLVRGGEEMRRAVEHILDQMQDKRLIFNLGHGILQQTPITHVEELVKIVRGRG